MVRESILDDTWKAIRVGMLALIRPVITSTDGRCVARIRWMPAARAFCATGDQFFHLLAHHHHQVGQLVDDDDDGRQLLQRLRRIRRQAEGIGIFSPRFSASAIFWL
jgi:hypothetical protein